MTLKKKRNEALYFLNTISKHFPDAKIELDYDAKDPWQLLVAVVLSAQATDKKVNEVTPKLFHAFPNVQAFARADPSKVEPYVKSLGFFRQKSKNLVSAAKRIVDELDGQVPKERDVLQTLAGVGPKSAAVILGNAFGGPGMPVDTHVGRVSRRLGLTKQTDPSKGEAELCALFPRERWNEAHHAFIWHGRRICKAPVPLCSQCPVQKRCPKVGVTKQR